MKLAIRLDDITPGMDWNKFNRMKLLLDDANICPLIGVVPRCKDPKLRIDPERADFWEYVRQLQQSGWTVALHGWKHVYTTQKGGLFPLNLQSEFAGHTLEHQRQMLQDGLKILHAQGIETDIFMAPSHTYDENTLQAMKECGLTRMTDGFGRQPYIYQGITFYPISMDRKHAVNDDSNGITTLVYHTNTMKEEDFADVAKLLRNRKDALVSYSDYLTMPARLRTAAGQTMENFLATAKRIVVDVKNRHRSSEL